MNMKLIIVHLKVDGHPGGFPFRCRQLLEHPFLNDQVLLCDCIDPIDTPFGTIERATWSVPKSDIVQYYAGILQEQPDPKDLPDIDEDDLDTEEVEDDS